MDATDDWCWPAGCGSLQAPRSMRAASPVGLQLDAVPKLWGTMISAPAKMLRAFWVAVACTLLLQLTAAQQQPDVLYVPTPYQAVNKMLEMAGVNSRSVVYDLGC